MNISMIDTETLRQQLQQLQNMKEIQATIISRIKCNIFLFALMGSFEVVDNRNRERTYVLLTFMEMLAIKETDIFKQLITTAARIIMSGSRASQIHYIPSH
mgnify:CR=1 FL=1